ncbi:hypothetical protein Tco_0744462 [Tanacetum coccineum]
MFNRQLTEAVTSRQCTNSDGDNVALCLLRRLAAPYLLRELATPYLLRRLVAPYLLRGLGTPYLLRRLYSLVIASRPEVAFVTPAILVDLLAFGDLGLIPFGIGFVQRLGFDPVRHWFRPEGLGQSLDLRGSAYFCQQLLEIYFDFHLTFLMAKKDMHTYVSRLKNTELETLIATYDIPLYLRPRLPDPNFRMINLPAGDTAIGIYSMIFDSSGVRISFSSFLLAVLKYFKVHFSQLVPLDTIQTGDWFSFAKRGDPAPVCMEVAKSGLKLWKEKFFLIDRRAIPFHMPWRHPDSCITYKVPTSFNQDHIDQLKAHIVKLCDIPEGVLVRSGLSRVWRNPMCDPVLRRSDNTVMSIYDFLCMPSLDKAMVREETHGLDTSILGRVADRITLPAPAGTVIPRASPKEISVTRPDRKVVTKADHATKQKASTGPEISTNAAKKTRSSKKGSGAGSSGQAAGDEVEQTDDGTLDDDDQRDGSEFDMEDIGNLNDVSQDKEVEAHTELSGGVRRATRASFHASHDVSEDASPPAQEVVPAPDTQPLDADIGADEIASDDLLPFVPGPYYIPYPYDEGFGSESLPYTKDDWEEIHGVNLGLRKKELYKDPKLITHGSMFNARYDHSLRNIERLSKQCAQQTQTIKRQSPDFKQQNESTVRANEEVSRLTAELGVLKSRCQTAKHKLSSWDKKHKKYMNERDTLAMEKAKIEEELIGTKFLKSGEFNQASAGVLNTAISVGVERGLRMGRTDEEFRGLSQRVVGFIPDAKEKFVRVVATFPNTTFPFLDKVSQNSQSSLQDIARLEPNRVTSSHQTSFTTASLRANTHV